MAQLLSIKSVPIKIEVNVTKSEFKPVDDVKKAPSVSVAKRNNGELFMEARPLKIDISSSNKFDTYSGSNNSSNGFSLTYEAIAKMSFKDGELAENLAVGVSLQDNPEFNSSKASRSINSILNSLPKSKDNSVSYNEGTLSINYDFSNYDAIDISSLSSGFEFIPGSIEFIISQMPDIEIEYLGDPLYFPRSANPNYEGIIDVTV